jgi:hypothetical protein
MRVTPCVFVCVCEILNVCMFEMCAIASSCLGQISRLYLCISRLYLCIHVIPGAY